MKTFLKIFAVVLLSSFTLAIVLRLDGNFEDGDRTIGGRLSPANPLTDSGAVITSQYAIGTKALKFTIDSNDSTGSFYPRSEYIISKNGSDSAVVDDYFGFNVTFVDWATDSRQGLITQSFTPAFPVFAVWFTTVGGKPWLQVVQQVDTTIIGNGTMDLYNATTNPTGTTRQTKYNIMEIIPNQTIRLDFKRKWRADYTGEIELWVNRQHVKTFTGANTIRPYNPSVFKQPVDRIGIYWFGAKSSPTPVLTRRAIFDNVSIGRASSMTWEQYLNYYTPVVTPPIGNDYPIYLPFKVN